MGSPALKPRLERDTVLAALRPRDVIDRYQLAGRERGDEWRTRLCPTCGSRGRADAVCINLVTGKWHCKASGCSGDIVALVAGLNQLDARRDFEQVLGIMADIAGVGPEADPAAVERHRERMRLEEEHRAREKAKRAEFAKLRAVALWRDLRRESAWAGEKYLREQRGLDAEQLVARDLVRFGSTWGDPHVVLWSSAGEIVNVVRRAIDPGLICGGCGMPNRTQPACFKCAASLDGADVGPKTPGLKDAPSAGTLVGHLAQLRAGGVAVVTEGVIDSLTAALAWPHAVVLGAHGAGQFAMIAKYAARRVVAHRGHLLLVGHNDPPRVDQRTGETVQAAGPAALDEAMHLALEEGVITTDAAGEPLCRVQVVDFGGHKDLNDAFRAGWRP